MSLSNTLSVQDYKDIFDANNYKNDSYEMAKFITFLMNKSKSNKEIEELTGLKKSQVFSYKKVIKFNGTEELRTTAFRRVLKRCTEMRPKVEKYIIQAIEGLALKDSVSPRHERPHRSGYEAPHYFNEMEHSPGKSTYYEYDFCPCGLNTGSTEGGEKFAHIPHLEIAKRTFLRLDEITAYEQQIKELKGRVEKLELENSALRSKSVKRTSV